jgi:hypothetical protein
MNILVEAYAFFLPSASVGMFSLPVAHTEKKTKKRKKRTVLIKEKDKLVPIDKD